jgi:preprotein translocase subunit SecF
MEFFKTTPRVPFMEKRRWAYAASLLMITASLVLLATRGLNFGIDFTGGVVIELQYPDSVDLDKAREALQKAGVKDFQATIFGSSRDLMVRVMPHEGEDTNQLDDRILQALRAVDPGVQVRSTDVVGPQVGAELAEQGGLAMLFTFLMILLYVGVRFEKKMATGTVLAALHDPLMILGFFAATQMTFDLSVLAAVLAVIGYSINDTVVVFDRVRETFHTMRKAAPSDVLNAALNQTLSRTLMTSFSTLFVVASLYVFGGEALKGFSIAIIIGVLVGTYSSIFIAAALALDMKLSAVDLMPPQKDKAELDAMP